MSAETLRRAAERIRKAAPLVEYTTEMAAPDRVKYVQYRRTPRNRWGWRNNVRPALRTLWPKSTSLDRALGVKWWQRPSFAWYTLKARDTRDVPEVALDGGNVLIFWSEVAPHMALWTPAVAADLADFLGNFNENLDGTGFDVNEGDCSCGSCEFAWKIARRILGEGA